MLELFTDALSIYKIGSSAFPFIKNPGDIDYLVVYPNNDLIEKNWPEILSIKSVTKYNQFWCVALEDFVSGKWLYLNTLVYANEHNRAGYSYFRTYIAPLNTLFIHWATLVEGQDIKLSEFCILDDAYLDLLKVGIKSVRFKLITFKEHSDLNINLATGSTGKCWYYLFIALFVYLNQSFDLTDEQINIINATHDCLLTWDQCVAKSEAIEDL